MPLQVKDRDREKIVEIEYEDEQQTIYPTRSLRQVIYEAMNSETIAVRIEYSGHQQENNPGHYVPDYYKKLPSLHCHPLVFNVF